jgi:diacylglycerol O-acyltransferase / wax synthase
MPQREVMSNVDRSWLLMDGPTNRMVINGVWIFSEKVDFQRMVETLTRRLIVFQRFRQRVVEPATGIGRVYWEDDPYFDIRTHIHRIALPAPGDRAALEDLLSSLVSDPLDPSHPLWEFYLIENYAEGSVVLGRIHHAIADGVALVRVMLSLADTTAEGTGQEPQTGERRRRSRNPLKMLIRQASDTMAMAANLGSTLLSQGIEVVSNPSHLVEMADEGSRAAGKGAAVLGKLTLMMSDSHTLFKGPLGVTKRVAWSNGIALDEVKFVKNRMGATVNDVLVAALAGGLRRYMISRNDSPAGKEVRAMVPVNVRPPEKEIELGNRFALVYLSLPVGLEDPLDRLFEVKRRMDKIKQSPEAVITYQIINGIGMLPDSLSNQIKKFFATKASSVLTNVHGPEEELYFAGSRIDKMIAWVPQSGSIGMGLSIFSYAGEVSVGVLTDEGLVPDPEGIVEGFHQEFAEMLALARLPDIEEQAAQHASGLATVTVTPQTATPQTGMPALEDDPTGRRVEEAAEVLLAQFLALKEEAIAQEKMVATEFRHCQALTKTGTPCKMRVKENEIYCAVHRPKNAQQ